MSQYNSKVDAYIEKSQPFAQPILTHIRETVHEFCPETEEAIKWGFPHFTYQGKNLCSMAAFKQHCAFGFWLENIMKTMKELTKGKEKEAMFAYGKIKTIDDLPSKVQMKKLILEAMQLTESGATTGKADPIKKEIEIPDYFAKALSKNKKAKAIFESKSPSFRKEYITWIVDAKTETTRKKRLEQALEWISEGKGRNWKYEKR